MDTNTAAVARIATQLTQRIAELLERTEMDLNSATAEAADDLRLQLVQEKGWDADTARTVALGLARDVRLAIEIAWASTD